MSFLRAEVISGQELSEYHTLPDGFNAFSSGEIHRRSGNILCKHPEILTRITDLTKMPSISKSNQNDYLCSGFSSLWQILYTAYILFTSLCISNQQSLRKRASAVPVLSAVLTGLI